LAVAFFPAIGFEGPFLVEGLEGPFLVEGLEGPFLVEGLEGSFPAEGLEGSFPAEGFEELLLSGLSLKGFSPNFRLPPSSFALWLSFFLVGVFPPCRSLIFRFLIFVKGYKDTAN
jgi:hypothetical protein